MIHGKRSVLFAAAVTMMFCQTQICFAQRHRRHTDNKWKEHFQIGDCTFSTAGQNKFFILYPGYQLEYDGKENNKRTHLTITVLNETVKIGNIETRIVEEKETSNNALTEISRNYFAICTKTQDVYYFGEDVDLYDGNKMKGHTGSWRAFSNGAEPGLMMPGTVRVGTKYYQESAPGVAMDRVEVNRDTHTIKTPAANFKHCLLVKETSPLEPGKKEYKIYAPGVGLVKDGELLLVKYGYTSANH